MRIVLKLTSNHGQMKIAFSRNDHIRPFFPSLAYGAVHCVEIRNWVAHLNIRNQNENIISLKALNCVTAVIITRVSRIIISEYYVPLLSWPISTYRCRSTGGQKPRPNYVNFLFIFPSLLQLSACCTTLIVILHTNKQRQWSGMVEKTKNREILYNRGKKHVPSEFILIE